MVRFILLMTFLFSACGLRVGSTDRREPPATANLMMQKSSSAQVFDAEPEVDTYAGSCIQTNNEPYINNAGETCTIVSQKYNAKLDICTEKILCEQKDFEITEANESEEFIP